MAVQQRHDLLHLPLDLAVGHLDIIGGCHVKDQVGMRRAGDHTEIMDGDP
jgi:hypothetical protein